MVRWEKHELLNIQQQINANKWNNWYDINILSISTYIIIS